MNCNTCKNWNYIFGECVFKDTLEPCKYESTEGWWTE